jgi:hypothetical protein
LNSKKKFAAVTVSAMNEGQTDLEAPNQIATKEHYHERRANLLSKIMENKQAEHDLMRDKLLVLQDVVQKQQHRQIQTLKALSLSLEQNGTTSSMIDQLRKNLTFAEELVDTLQSKLDKAEHSLTKRKGELQRQQLYYQSQLEEMRKNLDLANRESVESVKAQSALTEQLQQHVDELEEELRQARERHRESLEGVRSSLESKLAASRAQLEKTKRELSDVQVLNADYKRQTAMWDERMEIATASVQASERRENELSKQVEKLQSLLSSRNDAIRHLQAQMEDMPLELNNAQNQTVSASLILSQAGTIEELEEQIRNLKQTHAAQLRSQRKQFQQDMSELQKDFQQKFDGMRMTAASSARAVEASVAVAPSRPPSNVAKRFWKRIKQPFQRY